MTKMTYVMAIDSVLAGVMTDEVAEKLTALKVSLEKKNSSGSKSLTKNQLANEGLKAEMLEILANSEGMTATEVAKSMSDEMSNQKASALLKQLVDSGKAVKVKGEKGKTLFSLA